MSKKLSLKKIEPFLDEYRTLCLKHGLWLTNAALDDTFVEHLTLSEEQLDEVIDDMVKESVKWGA